VDTTWSLQLRCRVPTAAQVEADRSLALGSGHIMYSLQLSKNCLTPDDATAY
jgi:capsule polysaccharide export protein KpsC/LpsZ